jgi:hypothetical protein
MVRFRRPLLAVAFLALASVALARPPGASLRLLAPANGVTLRGGAAAELRWDAGRLPEDVEEWEAFLSVDGGRYYAFRLTPHLDLELRRFTFTVPNVDTQDARVLIRVGDEEEETGFEIPGSFSIVRDANAPDVLPGPVQFEHGEAAREGDPEVLGWVDGARNGSGLTQQSSIAVSPASLCQLTAAVLNAPDFLASAATSTGAPSIARTRRPVRGTHARKAESLPRSTDLLLVCRRRNI